MLDQGVHDRGAGLADFPAIGAGAMLQLKPVRLDFDEVFIARQFFRRGGAGSKGQARLGGGRDFFEQVLHERSI